VLEFLGLDETATAVYQALLVARGGLADICARTGLPEGVIRSALSALASVNLVRAPSGTSDAWRPVRPELGFAALVHEHEADLAQRAHQLAALRAAATAAAATWSAGIQHMPASVETLETYQDAIAEARWLASRATAEYLQVMPGAPDLAALHSELSPLAAAVARGARIRVLYRDSIRSDPSALAHARLMAQTGADVRTAPILPTPLVICDRQVALTLTGHPMQEMFLSVREPAIVEVLSAVFDNSWDTATPLSTRIFADDPANLTPGEQALLRLLAAGLTDEAAAKRLGVSLRTVRRQMQALMIRLQATSRFQAGLNAAQRGWL
jgi:DNA-binding CsgD family transcriptional regulator